MKKKTKKRMKITLKNKLIITKSRLRNKVEKKKKTIKKSIILPTVKR